eukprot:scaffold267428_cov33-Prasinocladus_malaysianus.AAC.1
MSAAVFSARALGSLAARAGPAGSAGTPRAARRSVVVQAGVADRSDAQAVSRRSAASLLAVPAALMFPGASRALIPDDDDEELVQKAKANRKARLEQDKKDSKEFVKSEGLQVAQDATDLGMYVAYPSTSRQSQQFATRDIMSGGSSIDEWID